VKYVLMALIRLYQLTISRMLGPVCRYYPSCSHYGYEAMSVHGAVKGTLLTAWRILRCNPWSAGGVDPVPERGAWRIVDGDAASARHCVCEEPGCVVAVFAA
jgi:putative membrane protein insertion efficiency factor